jgi:hypothetical protein
VAALVLRPLDEQGRDGRRRFPAGALRGLVENLAIAPGRRQQLDALEAREIHAEAARILQKQLGVRAARDQPARFFFVEVLGQFSPDFGDRALHIGAPDQYRKVAHVGRVLLLEVDV